jgi:alkylated DNA repair dioxygenase AlkB
MNSTSRHRVPSSSPSPQADLFTAPNGLLEGFCYRPNVLSPDEEGALVRELANLSFRPFDFHGYLATRQVVSFGYRYDYDGRAVVEASPFPSFLVSLPIKIAAIFDRPAETFRQVLINEYRPGAGSGWHRDKAQFDEVAACRCLPRASCVFDGRPVRLVTCH